MSEQQITQASENIFADLGFSPQEAENLRIRADLMITLRNLIETQHWTTNQAAQEFGTSRDQVEALIQGEIEQFQIESLVSMLTNAGMKVRVEVLPSVA
ncbi:XRE family transcriptional regulator [Pseudanabaenaceae cyanobacterium LEGE 13415]|nr:XRE family transcriptional regulator [Pseudanabaenaceae cyanobacterium LEGE 13415]